MNTKLKALVTQLKTDMAADKKKTGLLAGLFLVMLFVVGRLFIGSSDSATAATPDALAVSPTAVAPSGIGTVDLAPPPMTQQPIIQPQPPKIQTPKTLAPPPKVAGETEEEPTVDEELIESIPLKLARNPFDPTSWRSAYPEVVIDPQAESGNTAPSFFQRLAQNISDYQTQQEEAARKLDDDLVGLTVQSTMTGAQKAAYISGRLVHEGDSIKGFSVVKIEPGSVVLQKHGIQRTLSVP